MSSFGEKLKAARESHEVTLNEIAHQTKIKLAFLEALEQNDFDVLPGPAFGKFFIRSYAEVLGVEAHPLIVEYDLERQARRAQDSLESPEQGGERGGKKTSLKDRWERILAATPVEPPKPPAERPEEDEPALPVEAEAEDPAEVPRATAPPVTKDAPAELEPQEVDPPVEKSPPLEPKPGVNRSVVVAIVSVTAVVAIAAWLIFGGADEVAVEPVSAETVVTQEAPPADIRSSQPHEEPVEAEAVRAAPQASQPETQVAPPAPASELSVSHFGIGERVVDRRLQGEADQFKGGSVVAFATRVVGGRPGDTIRHVWLHEGRVIQTIRLEIGAAQWRTHSRKTLRATGSWAVEARDAEDRVLARATFSCY